MMKCWNKTTKKLMMAAWLSSFVCWCTVAVPAGDGEGARPIDVPEKRDSSEMPGPQRVSSVYEAYDVPTNITANISMDEFKTLQLLIHVNWIASRITQEGTVLEDEYKLINQEGLNLSYMSDLDARECLKQLSDDITNARKKKGDVKMAERVKDEELRRAFFESAPDPVAILSSNWRTMAFVAVQAGFSWYMNYQSIKRQVKLQCDQEMWRIEKTDMERINGSCKSMFEHQARLVKEYKLNDRFRVTSDEFKDLFTWLDKYPCDAAYHMLCLYKDTYALSTFYWYHRGVLAYNLGKTQEALKCFRTFQNIHVPFLKYDKTAALVAQGIIDLMGRGKEATSSDVDEIKKQLKVIKDNVRPEDWELHRFVALIDYGLLKDYKDAEEHICKAIDHLTRSYQSELKDYLARLSEEEELEFVSWWKERKENVPPSSDNLMHCRALLFQILSAAKDNRVNDFAAHFWSQYDVSNIERLMCSGYLQDTNVVSALCTACGFTNGSSIVTNCIEEVPSGSLSNESGKNLAQDVLGIMVDYDFNDHFWVYVPLRWVYTMPTNITFSIYGKYGAEIFCANEEVKKRGVEIKEIRDGVPVPVFEFVVDTRGAKKKVDVSQISGFSVNFEHPFYRSRLYVKEFDIFPSISDAIKYHIALEKSRRWNIVHKRGIVNPITSIKQDISDVKMLSYIYSGALIGMLDDDYLPSDRLLSKDTAAVVSNFEKSESMSAIDTAHARCFREKPQRDDALMRGYMLMYENKLNGTCTVIDFSKVFDK